MKIAYPITLSPMDGGGYLVYSPDFDINTSGKDLADAMYMARDAISLAGVDMIEDGRSVPEPSALSSISPEREDGIVMAIDVDFEEYRRTVSSKVVRKNCTVPSWLAHDAEEAGLNFSAALQLGLRIELGLGE